MSLPSRVVAGYYYVTGSSSNPLRELDAHNYNVVFIAFAKGTNSTSGTLHLPTPAQGDASFRSDISLLKSHGTKIILSIGGWDDIGSGGPIYTLKTNTQIAEATSSLSSLINSYGFDGIDWDLECPDSGNYNFTPSAAASVSSSLKTTFGSNFIITLAPEYFDAINSSGQYRTLANSLGNNLDAIGPQFYNHSGWTVSSHSSDTISAVNQLASAYGAGRVMIGYMSPDDNGLVVSITQEQTIWDSRVAVYPSLRGMYIWTTSADKTAGWTFADVLGSDILEVVVPPPSSPPPKKKRRTDYPPQSW